MSDHSREPVWPGMATLMTGWGLVMSSNLEPPPMMMEARASPTILALGGMKTVSLT
jgi:hypothetical protein